MPGSEDVATRENGREEKAVDAVAGESNKGVKRRRSDDAGKESNENELPTEPAKMEAFQNTLNLGVPVSTVISISSLGKFEALEDLCKILEGLLDNIDALGKTGDRFGIQTAILDASEFMVLNSDRLCTRDISILKGLRKQLLRFEELVNKLKSKFDYRSVSIFMEDSLGGESFTKNGALGSRFRKLKSKIFRAVTLTWEERDDLIETLLSTVNEKRRGELKVGRDEVRGYADMADEELQAWKIFASELVE